MSDSKGGDHDPLALHIKLSDAVNGKYLRAVLAEYEATGDHDHSVRGDRPIPPGAPCPGGDCNVARARALLAAIDALDALVRWRQLRSADRVIGLLEAAADREAPAEPNVSEAAAALLDALRA